MFTNRDYDNINMQIDCLTSQIDKNERSQDNWMCIKGEENTGLTEEHDNLVDEMHELVKKRHEIASDVF